MTPSLKALLASVGVLAIAGCDTPLDFDLRGATGGFSTAEAARGATENRPAADNRGVISYPNYQVAIARRGDTLATVAERIGVDGPSLASFNGIALDTPLRSGEVIALPGRVAEPSPATGAATTGPIQPAPVDVTTLASDAIDRAPDTTPTEVAATPAALPQTGEEPIRHQVERGETAFTISRLYGVPVRSLAEWNGLGPDFAIREGQFLLIPVARQAPPVEAPEASAAVTTSPGEGSATPTPPSASQPLPEDDTVPVADVPEPSAGPTTQTVASAMSYPVQGSIIRAYKPGRNEGIDIKASPGTGVKAAAEGTVAAITESAEGVPIVVIRHPNDLLTVYANVTDVSVKKGQTVSRDQSIAKLRDGDNAFVHFEVRDGFDSVDPLTYLDG